MKRQTLFALALFSGFIFLHCDKENPPAEAAPFITFRCPDDVTVHTTGSVGYVKYTAPDNLYTNCHSGGLSVALVSGIPSDDYFPVGTTVVVQKVSDACGNSATCSFNVTVVKDPVDGGGNGGTLDCSNAYNSDVEFVPYQLIGQQLIFHDETGLVKDTLTVESFLSTPVSYYQMGPKCARKIEINIATNWKNAAGAPVKLKCYLVDYFGYPERNISVEPGVFGANTLFYDSFFNSGNGRVELLTTYDFAGVNYDDVLLARCGEPGDSGYDPAKCDCPFVKQLIFSRNAGLVAYETSEGKWMLE